MLSIVCAIRRVGLRKEVGLLRPGALGHVVQRCFGTIWYSNLSKAQSTQDGDNGNEDYSSFAGFFKLDKYAMLSLCLYKWLAK